MEDPLLQYRNSPPKGAATTNKKTSLADAKKKPYESYDKKGKLYPYLEIRCVAQPSLSPQSRFFLAAVFSADFDDAFTLLYSFMAVEVKGSNLKEVRQAIQNSRCEFIQEFHKNEFQEPGKDEPVIASIRFITGDKLDNILSIYKR